MSFVFLETFFLFLDLSMDIQETRILIILNQFKI